MNVDIWLLILMPWLAQELHESSGRNLGAATMMGNSASLDTQNPLAAKLQKAKKEDRNNYFK